MNNISIKYRNNKLVKLVYTSTPKFLNDIIFSVYGFIKYFEYLRLKNTYLNELRTHQLKTKEEILQIQEFKLQKIIKHAYKNTEYYKKIIDESNLNPHNFSLKDLKKLPILSKDVLFKNNSELIASNFRDYKPVRQSSGGTTGKTIDFLLDKKAFFYREAEVLSYWQQHGYKPKESKAVMYRAGVLFFFFLKTPSKPWRMDYGRNLLYISSLYSSDDYYRKYYLKLKKWKPEFMHVLPSAGFLFACYLNENNLTLELKTLFAASEMLYPHHKESMEKAFKCNVVNHYGHSEPGIYAAGECLNNNLHIFDTNTIVEQDTDGSIIETSLNNYSMPFIRYKVGDKIDSIVSAPCGCGLKSKFITKINGRDSEIIYTGDGRKISTIGFDQIFRYNNIKMGQIVQELKGELILNIVPSNDFSSFNQKSVVQELTSRVGKETVINLKKVKHIDKPKSGKYRLIISKINNKD